MLWILVWIGFDYTEAYSLLVGSIDFSIIIAQIYALQLLNIKQGKLILAYVQYLEKEFSTF